MMKKKLRLAIVLIAAVAALVLAGCASTGAGSGISGSGTDVGSAGSGSAASLSATDAASNVRVGSLKGPTSIGLVNAMESVQSGSPSLVNTYEFTIAGSADELVPKLASGELDIALIPANLAATLYNRTEGGVLVLDINTMGVLYVVSGNTAITKMQDLAGQTVLMTGKGTTPEYVFNYLLEQSGLAGTVNLEFKSEATEVAAALAANPQAIGVLPEPYVTALAAKNPDLQPRISLENIWAGLAEAGDASGQLITGVTVVRAAFAAEHPQAVQEFVSLHSASANAALVNPAQTAVLVVKAGILDNEAVAQAAIPRCNLVCISGTEMETALSGYLQVLFTSDPTSVGGSLPNADFYYR